MKYGLLRKIVLTAICYLCIYIVGFYLLRSQVGASDYFIMIYRPLVLLDAERNLESSFSPEDRVKGYIRRSHLIWPDGRSEQGLYFDANGSYFDLSSHRLVDKDGAVYSGSRDVGPAIIGFGEAKSYYKVTGVVVENIEYINGTYQINYSIQLVDDS